MADTGDIRRICHYLHSDLKPLTPQNIVIGGASGAMPPVLGWAAVTGQVTADALLLFLIIFAWTPPHFWALALYRKNEYASIGMPMFQRTIWSPIYKIACAVVYNYSVYCDNPALYHSNEWIDLSGKFGSVKWYLYVLRNRNLPQL